VVRALSPDVVKIELVDVEDVARSRATILAPARTDGRETANIPSRSARPRDCYGRWITRSRLAAAAAETMWEKTEKEWEESREP